MSHFVIRCLCSCLFIIALLHTFHILITILLLYNLPRYFLWRGKCPTPLVLRRGKCPHTPLTGRGKCPHLLSREGQMSYTSFYGGANVRANVREGVGQMEGKGKWLFPDQFTYNQHYMFSRIMPHI